MHMDNLCCAGCADKQEPVTHSLLRGLAAGAGASVGGAVGTAYGGPVGGAIGSAIGGALLGDKGGGGAAPSTYVATNVNTTVSPQISPNFIQQDSPTNSPVNASTSQSMPNAYGGGGAGYPQLSPTYMPTSGGFDYNILLYGAIAALGIAYIVKQRNSPQSRANRREKRRFANRSA